MPELLLPKRTMPTHAIAYVKLFISSYVCHRRHKRTWSGSAAQSSSRLKTHRSAAVREDGPDVRVQPFLLVRVEREEDERVRERVCGRLQVLAQLLLVNLCPGALVPYLVARQQEDEDIPCTMTVSTQNKSSVSAKWMRHGKR